MKTDSPFLRAVQLTQPFYDSAAIHAVAELRGSEWFNLYTSVIYGRESDLRSVPTYVDSKCYGPSILCLRTRLSRAEADAFVAAAKTGKAFQDSWTIVYALDEPIAGFRPATSFSEMSEKSFWETSLWTNEHTGAQKVFNGYSLAPSTAWRVAEYLPCLEEARWAPIPLHRHPEKLGDLDQIWPSPVTLQSGGRDGILEFEVISDIRSLLEREISVAGTLLRDDLVAGSVVFSGKGPHQVPVDIDGIDLLVSIDGLPIDGQAHFYFRSFTMSAGIGEGRTYVVPEDGARPEMKVPLGFNLSSVSTIGTPRPRQERRKAWRVGRALRTGGQPFDAEHLYDLENNRNAVEQAFQHLQQYGSEQTGPEILVADPYAFDERALHAIAILAARNGPAASITVLTAFQTSPQPRSLLLKFFEWFRANLMHRNRQKVSARMAAESKARDLALRIAKELKVQIAFYRISGLHDRFLLVGERLWHVGCSFNTLGEEISAVVEMKDERVKASVLAVFERCTSQNPIFEAKP